MWPILIFFGTSLSSECVFGTVKDRNGSARSNTADKITADNLNMTADHLAVLDLSEHRRSLQITEP